MVAKGSNLLSGVNVEVSTISTLTSAPSLDASNNQIKNSLAAIDASNNQIKNSLVAIDASNNQIKNSLAAIDASNNQVKNSLAAIDASVNLVKLNLDASINFGRNVRPTWITPDISSNAAANSDLVTQRVSAGKVGYIYGWEIASEDTSNNFTLNWTSGAVAKTLLLVFGGSGNSMNQYTGAAANEGQSADAGTYIYIKNTVAAQSAKRLQARLLFAEV